MNAISGFFSSLRVQLMLLVLLPAVPVAVLMIHEAIDARENATLAARRELAALAEFAALHLDRAVRATQQQLGTLADVPAVNGMEEPSCSAALAALQRRTDRYTDLVVVTPGGGLRCSSVPLAAVPRYAGREIIRQALASPEAVVGTPYVEGLASGLPVALALRDADGAPRGVVVTLLDLNWFAKPFGDERFRSALSFALWDSRGRLMYRYPEPEKWVGKLLADTPLARAVLSAGGAGSAEVPGVDGVARLHAFAASQEESKVALRISVGVNTAELYREADQQLRRSLTVLAVVSLAALAAAWLLSEIVVRRRIGALVGVAGRLAGGDLAARAAEDYGGETGQLAQAFNRMAAALETQMAALRGSEARFRETLDSMLEGCQIIDFDWRYVYVNDSAAAHGRQRREDLLGRRLMDVYPGIENTEMFDILCSCMTERTTQRRENKFVYADGSWAWFDVSVHPSPEGIFVVSFDITERKRAEELSQEMNVELERRVVERTAQLSASNAELERFAYVASHDLQEPLRMVASYVQLLERRYRDKLNDEAREFIGFAVDGAKRMQGLINDLLQYSRVEARGKSFASTDLNRVLDAVRADLDVSIKECGADVGHDRLPTLAADATQLRQLLQNLIGNALKYRGETAPRIHVAAQRIEAVARNAESAWLDWPDTAPTTGWLLSVRDNGIGIDPQYRERIFQLFQRLHTRQEYPGTGLGLALCKRIVERHGGAIWVRSQPGEGAVFYVALPDNECAVAGDEQEALHVGETL
ncbi:MAG: PAS domain-containing protein [Gammaproteobacteria bacterium]|nr:PAS domain-containing protein [Gammaproteobacteria bacterium]